MKAFRQTFIFILVLKETFTLTVLMPIIHQTFEIENVDGDVNIHHNNSENHQFTPKNLTILLEIENTNQFKDCEMVKHILNSEITYPELNELRITIIDTFQNDSNLINHRPSPEFPFLTIIGKPDEIQNCEFANFSKVKNVKFISVNGTLDLNLNSRSFAHTVSLQKLQLFNIKLETLPEGIFDNNDKLQSVRIQYSSLKTLPKGLFKSKKYLKIVSFKGSKNLKITPNGLFSNLTSLEYVSLARCNLESLPEDTFQGSVSLVTIILNSNSLQTLPKNIFDGLRKLHTLDLSNNQITILPDQLFDSCGNLNRLYINNNNIAELSRSVFKSLIELEELLLNHNEIAKLEEGVFSALEKVSDINLSNNNITRLTLASGGNGSTSVFSECRTLARLNLSGNKIESLFRGLFVSSSLFLDLSNNSMTTLTDDLNFHYARDFNATVRIENNPIECDCLLFNFMKQKPKGLTIDKEFGKCSGPKVYKNIPLSHFISVKDRCAPSKTELNNSTMCPRECDVWMMDSEHQLFLNCSRRHLEKAPTALCSLKNESYFTHLDLTGNFIKEFPDFQKTGYNRVRGLYLSDNKISTIPKDIFSGNLKELFADNNQITTISKDVIEGFTNNLLNAKFGNNPYDCDCEKIGDFQRYIRNSVYIKDAFYIFCKNSNSALERLSEKDDLCHQISSIVALATLAFTFLLLLLLYVIALSKTFKRDVIIIKSSDLYKNF